MYEKNGLVVIRENVVADVFILSLRKIEDDIQALLDDGAEGNGCLVSLSHVHDRIMAVRDTLDKCPHCGQGVSTKGICLWTNCEKVGIDRRYNEACHDGKPCGKDCIKCGYCEQEGEF